MEGNMDTSQGMDGSASEEVKIGVEVVELISAAETDKGKAKEVNEDSFHIKEGEVNGAKFGVYLVADGVTGKGEGGGEMAAQAIERFFGDVLDETPDRLKEVVKFEGEKRDKGVIDILQNMMRVGDRRVRKEAKGESTTATAVIVIGDEAYVVSVGDSRAYLVGEGGEFERLTLDNTEAEAIVSGGESGDVRYGRKASSLIYHLGMSGEKELPEDVLEVEKVKLGKGDKILVCSDGLWGEVKDGSWKGSNESETNDWGVIQDNVRKLSPKRAVKNLVMAANERGGRDNITALVVERR